MIILMTSQYLWHHSIVQICYVLFRRQARDKQCFNRKVKAKPSHRRLQCPLCFKTCSALPTHLKRIHLVSDWQKVLGYIESYKRRNTYKRKPVAERRIKRICILCGHPIVDMSHHLIRIHHKKDAAERKQLIKQCQPSTNLQGIYIVL